MEIPEIGEAFHKSRRNLGLYSALLIGWELVGAEISEVPFENFKITLKNPDAIPYILIILIIYFGFRLTIEWNQCNPKRKKLTPSIIDYYTAITIALLAIVIFIGQRGSNFELANLFNNAYFLTTVISSCVTAVICRIAGVHEDITINIFMTSVALVLSLVFCIGLIKLIYSFNRDLETLIYISIIGGIIGGILAGPIIFYIIDKIKIKIIK